MAVDEREQARKLSEAEERRLQRYQQTCDELLAQGYRCAELTVGIVRANVFSLVAAVPIVALGLGLFFWVNREITSFSFGSSLASIVAILVLVVVHEGIHGLTWGLFAKHHFADIEFGVMWEYLTPYCSCTCPLDKWAYIAGALAPLVCLGIVPTAVAIANGSLTMLMVGLVMVLAAGGDVMIVAMLLSHRMTGRELLVLDHPTQAGSVVFER